MNLADMNRPVKIHVCKDGTITYRRAGKPVFNNRALPFFSVNTEEEAQTLQVLLCSSQYEEHPDLPGQTWYRHWQFGGELEDIQALTETFNNAYEKIRDIGC